MSTTDNSEEIYSNNDDQDIRQLNQMLKAIDAYLDGEISIHSLVGTLSFLHTNLDEVTEEWKEHFVQKWGLLEILNAESREERRHLTEKEQIYAETISRDIRLLVSNLLEP